MVGAQKFRKIIFFLQEDWLLEIGLGIVVNADFVGKLQPKDLSSPSNVLRLMDFNRGKS